MKTAIILTSIFEPDYLKIYEQNLLESGIENDEVCFIVIGDNKTPHESYRKIQCSLKYPLFYLSPIDQKYWINDNKLKIDSVVVPENSSRRRNIGYLFAMQTGFDNYIVIDDDNLPVKGTNWLRSHISALTRSSNKITVSSKNKYVNPCAYTKSNTSLLYARGYPISEYFKDTFFAQSIQDCNVVDVNTALWVDDPDIDAGFHLLYDNVKSISVDNKSFVIGYNNYIPINSQNTMYSKRISPIFWNVHQPNVLDVSLDRFDDIWNGLFISKVLHRIGGSVSFGNPVVLHKRNSHNYNKDFKKEHIASIINCELWNYISKEIDVYSSNVIDCYREIATELCLFTKYENDYINEAINEIGDSMIKWTNAVEQLC